MGTMSRLVHCSPENTSPAKTKWQKLKLYVQARKTRVSTAPSSENQITVGGRTCIVLPENTRTKIEHFPCRTLREVAMDYFDTIDINLLLLDDLNNYINLMVSISNSINDHNEAKDVILLVEKFNELKKERDPFPVLVEMLPVLSEQRRKIKRNIQVMEEKNNLKIKICKVGRKILIRTVSWLVFFFGAFGLLVLSFVAPNMVPMATAVATIIRPLEEQMLTFCMKREGELKEMTQIIVAIKEDSVLEDPPLITRIEKFSREDVKKFEGVVDKLVQDKKVNAARKGLEGLGFQRRAVELKKQMEKWVDFIKQGSRKVVYSLKT